MDTSKEQRGYSTFCHDSENLPLIALHMNHIIPAHTTLGHFHSDWLPTTAQLCWFPSTQNHCTNSAHSRHNKNDTRHTVSCPEEDNESKGISIIEQYQNLPANSQVLYDNKANSAPACTLQGHSPVSTTIQKWVNLDLKHFHARCRHHYLCAARLKENLSLITYSVYSLQQSFGGLWARL